MYAQRLTPLCALLSLSLYTTAAEHQLGEGLSYDPDRRDPFYSSIDSVLAQAAIDRFLNISKAPTASLDQEISVEDIYKQCQLFIAKREWRQAIEVANKQLLKLDKHAPLSQSFHNIISIASAAHERDLREQAFAQLNLTIQGILWSEDSPLVVINGHTLRQGETISKAVTVKRIYANRIDVDFLHNGTRSEFHVYMD